MIITFKTTSAEIQVDIDNLISCKDNGCVGYNYQSIMFFNSTPGWGYKFINSPNSKDFGYHDIK